MMNSLILQDLQLKKMKEFKFQQNLRIEFIKNDEIFKNKVFANPLFD